MTLRANGFMISCDECTRTQVLPDRTEDQARTSAHAMGWRESPGRLFGINDICPQCVPLVELRTGKALT